MLSTAKEKTLLKAITRLSKSGYPITLLLIRDLAKEIRLSRFRLSSSPTSYPPTRKLVCLFVCFIQAIHGIRMSHPYIGT
jgi:hypothetical protein